MYERTFNIVLNKKNTSYCYTKKSFFTYFRNLQKFDMALSYILYYVNTDVMISLPGICLTYGKISPCEVMNYRNISNN